MKKADEICIREAMNSRLSPLEASAERRARIRQRIEREEEPEVKRKLSIGMAFALIAVLALGGIALAAGLNVFDIYDEDYPKLTGLAPLSAMEEVTPVTIETEELGTTTAAITNAYYDGLSLIVGYSIENGSTFEAFDPSEDELKNKQPLEIDPEPWARNLKNSAEKADEAAIEEIVERCRKGEPFGLIHRVVYGDSYAAADEGAAAWGGMAFGSVSEGGVRYQLTEFESPLPEAVRDLDRLTVTVRLRMDSPHYYFDGETLYYIPMPPESIEKYIGEVSAEVHRSESMIRNFTGECEIDGAKVTAEAWLSPVYGMITLRAGERVLDMPDPFWGEYRTTMYGAFIADAEGKVENTLRVDQYGLTDDLLGMEIGFNGSGEAEVTDRFTLYLMHWDDMQGYWGYDDVLEKGIRIEMKSVE